MKIKFLKRKKCKHEYWPEFYARVYIPGKEIYSVLDKCIKCGHKIIRSP